MSTFSKAPTSENLTSLEFRCDSLNYPGKLCVLENGNTVFIGPLTPTGIKSAVEAIELELTRMLPKGAS